MPEETTPCSPLHHGTSSLIGAFFGVSRRPLAQATPNRRKRAGQGLVEYALILMLLAVVVIGSLTIVGASVSGMYTDIKCAFPETADDPEC